MQKHGQNKRYTVVNDKTREKRLKQAQSRAYDGAFSFASSRDALFREVMRDQRATVRRID